MQKQRYGYLRIYIWLCFRASPNGKSFVRKIVSFTRKCLVHLHVSITNFHEMLCICKYDSHVIVSSQHSCSNTNTGYQRIDTSYALAKRTRKSKQILNLRSTCVSFGHLHGWTSIDCARLPFGRTQICVKFTTFCDLNKLASRPANPFGHPSQIRSQVLVLQICIDLHRLESPFCQGFTVLESTHVHMFSHHF